MVPAWMRNVTFVAWLASLFVPQPFIKPGLAPIVSGVLTMMLGAAAGPAIVDKLRGEPKE